MLEAVKTVVEHLFNKHDFCGAWCKHRTLTLEQKEKQQQYYHNANNDAVLYKQLTDTVVEFSTEEHLLKMGIQVWGYEKFWREVYGEFGIDVGDGMEKYLFSMDKSCMKHQDYKKETCNRLKCAKANMEKMKIGCAKVKKDQEDEHGYGDDKGCNLSGGMISTCV
eukprot:4787971-Ditylum_brightwellii.AAC.1